MKHRPAWMCIVGCVLAAGITEGRAPAPVTEGPGLDKATLAEVRKLQEKRRETLLGAVELREKLYRTARTELGEVLVASKRLLTAELELAATATERIAAHERHLEKTKTFVVLAKEKMERARGTHIEVLEAQDALLEAKIGLLKAGGKPKKAEK